VNITELLKNHAYYQMPHWLLSHKELEPCEKMLYMILLNLGKLAEKQGQCDESGVYVPLSVERAADYMGCSEGKARKILCLLENKGLLCKKQRGAMKSNIYYLLPPEMTEDRPKTQESAEKQPPKTQSPPKTANYYCPGSALDHDAIMNNYRPPF